MEGTFFPNILQLAYFDLNLLTLCHTGITLMVYMGTTKQYITGNVLSNLAKHGTQLLKCHSVSFRIYFVTPKRPNPDLETLYC